MVRKMGIYGILMRTIEYNAYLDIYDWYNCNCSHEWNSDYSGSEELLEFKRNRVVTSKVAHWHDDDL